MTEAATIARDAPARALAAPAAVPRYWAFLSYSHRDKAWAERLHAALETYRVPAHLVGRVTVNGIVPPRLHPIFRDRQELAASDDLGADIRAALAESRFLLVLCSPAAATSHWTDAEIATFKRLRPEGCVLAAIVAGEPFASDTPGREAEECFPPALRRKFDRRGKPTAKRAEPIAADLRESGDGERMGKLKLIAGMLGVGLDELARRESQRRQKRLAILAVASVAGMVATSGLALAAVQARDEARDQRAEAEGLIGFMLGDLRGKLEPLGRLDVLDSVGAKALGYYRGQDKSSLSEDGLAQRSRALTLIGEIANKRGDLDGALQRYLEALSGTGEALARAPDDEQRIFDHAQNIFWIGYIAWQRGLAAEAEARFGQYRELARRLVSLNPDKHEWRLEALSADTNLGALLLESGRAEHAIPAFESAVHESEKLVEAMPRDRSYQKGLSESLAYLADAQRDGGRLEDAMASRERQLSLLTRMSSMHGVDAAQTRAVMTARQALGNLFASRGDVEASLDQFASATRLADELVRIEPENMEWQYAGAGAQGDHAELLLATGRIRPAERHIRAGCVLAGGLARRSAGVAAWRTERIGQCLRLRAEASAANGRPAEALALAQEAIASAERREGGKRTPLWIVAATRISGDQRLLLGDYESAAADWRSGLSAVAGSPPTAKSRHERYLLLRRLGRFSEAASEARVLNALGYRHPGFTSVESVSSQQGG